jgi:hypothetical protein
MSKWSRSDSIALASLGVSLLVAIAGAIYALSATPTIQGTFTPMVGTWVSGRGYFVSVTLGIHNSGRSATLIENMWLELDPCTPQCGSPHTLGVFDREQRQIVLEKNEVGEDSETEKWVSLDSFSPFGVGPSESHAGTYSFFTEKHEWLPKGQPVNKAELCLWVDFIHEKRQKLSCTKFEIGEYPKDQYRIIWYRDNKVPGISAPTSL